MKSYRFLFLFVISIFSRISFAKEVCPNVITLAEYQTLLDQSNLTLLEIKENVRLLNAHKQKAAGEVNPELEFFAVHGQDYSVSNLTMTESRLWFTIRTASKISKAHAVEEEISKKWVSEYDWYQFKLVREVALSLLRLKQIEKEQIFTKNSLDGTEKIFQIFKSRKILSPDQKFEKSLLDTITDEYEIKLAHLQVERRSIVHHLEDLIGYSCSLAHLVSPEFHFPVKLGEFNEKSIEDSYAFRNIRHDVNIKIKKIAVEESLATPDLRVGPVIQSYSNGGPQFFTGGFMFSFPLAIFNRNHGARVIAESDLNMGELRSSIEKISLGNQIKIKINEYQVQHELLSRDKSLEKLQENLSKMPGIFKSGRMNLNLMVELQIKLTDFTKTMNDQQMKALNAYFDVQELVGQSPSVAIRELLKGDI